MNVWTILALVGGGLFAGGAITIAWERIPSWRKMPQAQFLTDFADVIRMADRVQPAVLMVSLVAALGVGVTSQGTAQILALIGATGLFTVLAASVVVLVPLQRRMIASSSLTSAVIDEMQSRWFRGHVGRSALALVSYVFVATAAAV